MKLQDKILSVRLLDLLRGKTIGLTTIKGDNYEIRLRSDSKCTNITGSTDIKTTLPTDTTMNYFDFNKKNKITCIDEAKHTQEVNDHGKWKKDKRQELKPGKFLNRIDFEVRKPGLKTTIEGEERKKVIKKMIETFVSQITAKNKDLNFELSDTPSEVYELKTKQENTGHLECSCMRPESGHGCKEHSQAYDKIGDNVKVIYKNSEEGLLYRVLLWTGEDSEGKKIQFLDRIYGNDTTRTGLENHARENNMAYRNESGEIIFNDEPIEFIVNVGSDFIRYITEEGTPYFDTLKYCDNIKNIISNSDKHNTSDFDLQCCGGSAQDNLSSYYCVDCNEGMEGDEVYFSPAGDHVCQGCYDDSYFFCDNCNETLDDDDYATDGICVTCANNQGIVNCDSCGDWGEHTIYIESEDQQLCEGCAGDYTYCEGCEDYHHIDNTETSGHDEETRCNDCHKEHEKEHQEEIEIAN